MKKDGRTLASSRPLSKKEKKIHSSGSLFKSPQSYPAVTSAALFRVTTRASSFVAHDMLVTYDFIDGYRAGVTYAPDILL